MEWVSEVTVGKASYKAVLIALANFHHQKDDQCRASIETITEFTELNRKTVMPILDWLQEAGLINFEKGSRRHRKYTLNFDVKSPKVGTIKNPDKSPNLGTKEKGSNSPNIGTLEANPIVPKSDSYSPKNDVLKSQPLDHTREHGNTRDIPPIVPHDEKSVANRVIESLNHHAGKNYRLTDNNRKPIIARLRDGFTEGDCVQVITNRVSRWQGTELAQYLRPDTLFRPSKFESYLNDAGETGTSSSDPVYDPGETERLLRETFPDDDPGLKALPGGPRWKH